MPILQLQSQDQPFESPDSVASNEYEKISPSLGETLSAAGNLGSTSSWLGQAAERGSQDPNSNTFDQAAAFFLKGQDPLQTYLNQQNNPQPQVTPEDAKKNYNLTISHPVPENLARLMSTEQTQKAQQEDTLQRFDNVHSWPVNLGVGLAGFIQDPVNIASLFIPGIGEERGAFVAGKLGLDATGFAGKVATETIKGASQGAVGQTALSGIRLAADPEYGIRDAAKDVLYGSVSGAVLGSMFGIGRGVLTRTLDKTITAETNHTAFSTSMAQILDEKPISVADIFNLHDVSEATSSSPYDSEMFESDAQRSGRLSEAALQRNLGLRTLKEGQDNSIWGGIEDGLSAFKDLYGDLKDTPSPAQMVKTQQSLDSIGYAQGMSNDEYFQAYKDLQDSSLKPTTIDTEDASGAPTKPLQPQESSTPSELPANEGKLSTDSTQPLAANAPSDATEALTGNTDPRITALEEQFKASSSKYTLSPEEQATLDRTQSALQEGPKQDAAYNQAAQCIKDSGIQQHVISFHTPN